MALKLYYHPLSSFCHKVLIALYENATPFEPVLLDFSNEASAAGFKKLWPIGKFPVLHDEDKDRIVPEATIIIEYLAQHYPGRSHLIPRDEDAARQMRLRDRFFDLYVHVQMQKIMGDRRRPAGKTDPQGVAEAHATIATALDMFEQEIKDRPWVMGDAFTMADCAAAPALFYGNMAHPFEATHPNVARYLVRLKQRPSYARALAEAEPYFHLIPREATSG